MRENKEITVVIADDHPLLLKGLQEELLQNGYNVAGVAKDGMEALQEILVRNPDIALLDIDMPLLSGFEVIKIIKEKGYLTKCIVLSFHKETEYITKAKTLHINGYLLKEDPFYVIDECIKTVLTGGLFFSPSISGDALIHASEELQRLRHLTPSELTILKLISTQKSTLEIAEELFVSKRTVEKHRSNIIEKLKLENNALSGFALLNKNILEDL